MSKRARTRATRRDRRKAKASRWTRQGKPQMGHVGHGASGPTGSSNGKPIKSVIGPVPHTPQPKLKEKFKLRVSFAELVKTKL